MRPSAFWPAFFGLVLIGVGVLSPVLAWRWSRRTAASPLRKGAVFFLAGIPAAFIVADLGASAWRHLGFRSRWSDVETGASIAEVERRVGPPDLALDRGSVMKTSAGGNRWPLWIDHSPGHRGLLRLAAAPPWFRFRCDLDDGLDRLEGGVFGTKADSFILQCSDDRFVRRKDGWD